jgi:hypothetical protein
LVLSAKDAYIEVKPIGLGLLNLIEPCPTCANVVNTKSKDNKESNRRFLICAIIFIVPLIK